MADEDISKNIAIAFQFGLAMGFAKKCDECDDCISRQIAVDYLCTHCPDDAECLGDCDTIKNFKSLPLVTPKPKKGRWILTQRDKCIDVSCSECGNIRFKDYTCSYAIEINDLIVKQMNYCECCGAKMEIKQGE